MTSFIDVLHSVSPAFRRRRLKTAVASLGPHSTDKQKTTIKERVNKLHRKIKSFFKVQQLYMPSAAILQAKASRLAELEHAARSSQDPIPDEEPQDMQLWLPSFVARKAPCDVGLQRIEFKLREAQAHEALDDLRRHLRYTSHLWTFKDRFERGTRRSTRSRTIIQRSQDNANAAAQKYKIARKALLVLGAILGESEWQGILRELHDTDIRGMSEAALRDSEGRRTLSWIWRTVGIGEDVDKGLHDGESSFLR